MPPCLGPAELPDEALAITNRCETDTPRKAVSFGMWPPRVHEKVVPGPPRTPVHAGAEERMMNVSI
jgi:hypothetical protein